MGLSVKFNGFELNKYIDVLIGFTPFSGADWSPEFLEDAGLRRGADFSYTTYKQKQIPMPYTVLEDLKEKHDELARILNVSEPKELVFGNAPDRVFYAVPTGDLDFDDYECFGEGVITWLVPDGLAHSTVEKVFTASPNADGILEAVIVNEGTEAVPVSYEIVHNHENGYIGIVSEYGVMQYGRVEEADGEVYKQNEILAGIADFASLPDDNGTNYMHPNHTTAGTLVVEKIGGRSCLRLQKVGNAVRDRWNGGMKTLVLPADSEGSHGAKNFYCYLNHWFETGLMGQTGEQSIAFLTEDNKIICGYSLFKSDMSGNTAHLEFWANGKMIRKITFTPSYSDNDNPFNNGRGHSDIRKEGDKLTFYWWGGYPSYTIPEIRDMECTKIQVAFTQFDLRMTGDKYVTRNYLREITFQKMHVEKWRDVPNRYPEGSRIFIDGEAAKVYVNGMADMGDEMVGTKYFHVPPGETKVQFYHSGFSDPPPTITARIREVYL